MECEAAGVEVSFLNHDPPFWECFPPDITQPHKSLQEKTNRNGTDDYLDLLNGLSFQWV